MFRDDSAVLLEALKFAYGHTNTIIQAISACLLLLPPAVAPKDFFGTTVGKFLSSFNLHFLIIWRVMAALTIVVKCAVNNRLNALYNGNNIFS